MLTFTLFDGWVLARSAFHHSAHYRSAVVFGQFEIVDCNKKDRLLNHFIEQIAPGRTEEVRLSNEKELKATMLLRIPLTEASVKISNFGVNDDAEDMDIPVWAGVLPYRTIVAHCKLVTICMKVSLSQITVPILIVGRNKHSKTCPA